MILESFDVGDMYSEKLKFRQNPRQLAIMSKIRNKVFVVVVVEPVPGFYCYIPS